MLVICPLSINSAKHTQSIHAGSEKRQPGLPLVLHAIHFTAETDVDMSLSRTKARGPKQKADSAGGLVP